MQKLISKMFCAASLQADNQVVVVSVVLDSAMYERLVKNNPYNSGARFIAFDNRTENKGVAERYNGFLDTYDYNSPAWFVFCHEDWEIKEDWFPRFQTLSKKHLYGPIGSVFKDGKRHSIKYMYGEIENSAKDGSRKIVVGIKVKGHQVVNTFDCQCLIVHSDLVKKHHLRFDDKLLFDLYVEDFCINALERHGIISEILQLKCQHYSFGSVQPRFYEGLAYLNDKYKDTGRSYGCTVGHSVIGNQNYNKNIRYKGHTLFYKIRRFFFQVKITKSDKLVVKLCRIPLPVNWFKKLLMNCRGKSNEKAV